MFSLRSWDFSYVDGKKFLLKPNLKANFNPCRVSLVQELLQGYDFYVHQVVCAHTHVPEKICILPNDPIKFFKAARLNKA